MKEVFFRLKELSEKDVDSYAQYRLGKIYEEGHEGATKDIDRAIYWYFRSLKRTNYAQKSLLEIANRYPERVKKIQSKLSDLKLSI